jgi:predicted DNA-binding protein with PD1-like motif
MHSGILHEAGGQRTFVIVLRSGEEALASLGTFAEREDVAAASFTAIGAFSDAVLGYFDWQRKEYRHNPVDEQTEVASLIGDVALGPEGKRSIHMHVVLGRRDGGALAGHLLTGHVRPTLEVVLTESPAHLHKRHDFESGLALIELDA